MGQQLGTHGHQQPVVAGRVVDQRVHQFGRHERRVAGLGKRVAQELEQLLARGQVPS